MKVCDISPVLFREYDLRGIVNDILDEDVAYTIGLAYGSYLIEHNSFITCVGKDNRVSGDVLTKALIKGILETGCNVIDVGVVTTPMLYFARLFLKTYAGIMVTASHNSKEYNGFKFSFDETGNAFGYKIQDFYSYCKKKEFKTGKGEIKTFDIKPIYYEYLANSIKLKNKDLKVVVDCGNGVGSEVIKDVLDSIGLTSYYLLYCESDGSFPNHLPDPSVSSNLSDLKKKVVELGYDLGIGIDGDGDRVAIVSEKGEFISADIYMLLMARYLKDNLKDNKVLFDVKCSRALIEGLKQVGVNPVMTRTGSSYMVNRVRDENFSFAGEYSGHIFYNDKWFGFDDGIYAGCRFMEMLTDVNKKVSELLETVKSYPTYSLDIYAGEDKKKEVINKVIEYVDNKNYISNKIDGVRVELDNGWGLIRCSNTGPNIVTRFEANNEKELDKIKDEFISLVKEYIG